MPSLPVVECTRLHIQCIEVEGRSRVVSSVFCRLGDILEERDLGDLEIFYLGNIVRNNIEACVCEVCDRQM